MTPDERATLANFHGEARLFPLPNLVLFPGVEQNLHIFEARYRQMTADALASDGLLAMVLLKPDWEPDYDHEPPIEHVACLGRIAASELLPDGRYNLRLSGLCRIRIQSEGRRHGKLYRTATAELLTDDVTPNLTTVTELRLQLRNSTMSYFHQAEKVLPYLERLFDSDLLLGTLCDQLSYSLPMPLPVKQHLLEECRVTVRVQRLLALLQPPKPGSSFPAQFSCN